MTSTEDTIVYVSELKIIHEYLFVRYDKLVVDVNNPSIMKEDREANDKRFDIIKHFKDNDKGINSRNQNGCTYTLHALCTKYIRNFSFPEPYTLIDPGGHELNLSNKFNPYFGQEKFLSKKELYNKYIYEDINFLYFKYKAYYDKIIINKYCENSYDRDDYIAFSFIDKLFKGIKKDKEEEIIEQQKLEEKQKLEEQKKLDKQKKLEEKQKLEEQKKLDKQKKLEEKQKLEKQKKLDKQKKLEEKQKLEEQTITKSKSDCEAHKKKKKPISATIKRLVWNTNIGEQIGKAKCMCCNVTDITQMSFNCGHIIAESNGGETIVSNLKPICQNCNSSMGTKDMEEFIKTLK
jgi:5-methylcytosine-specific restriction endonuclease McrA